jgi:beta-ureidopropionase / N-carbamoyl-L-amino-acid hydrolase
MLLRHDALTAAAHIIAGVERLAMEQDDTAVATVGRLAIAPNIINTIPGTAIFSVDFRHRDPAVLDRQVDRLRNLVQQTSQDRGVDGQVNRFWTSEPTPFDPTVVSAIRSAVSALGLPEHELWSGAGHDAKYVADVCPAGMIFIRSQGGLSHCETESSSDEDLIAGANVLLLAMLELAA